MSILVIGPEEEAEIARAIERAMSKPLPLSVAMQIAQPDRLHLNLADRKGPVELARQEYPAQQVMLGTYRAAFSFEEEPAGLVRHLSVSSHRPGKIPGPEVLEKVCEAFGFSEFVCGAFGNRSQARPTDHLARIWAEEFDPGHYAINVIELEGA